jgi:hypothetical protein
MEGEDVGKRTNSQRRRLTTCSAVRGSNPREDEIYRNRPDRLWGAISVLYSGVRVSVPGEKRPGSGLFHLPLSSAEIKEIVDIPSWPVIG